MSLVIVLLFISSAFVVAGPDASASGRSAMQAHSDAPAGPSLATLESLIAAAGNVKSLPAETQPAQSDWTSIYADFGAPFKKGSSSPCWDGLQTETSLPTCTFGDKKSTKTLVLTGDSQAWMWEPAFNLWGIANHYRVIVLTKSACQPWEDAHQVYADLSPFPECAVFQSNAVKKIDQLKPAIIVAAGAIPSWPAGYCTTCSYTSRLNTYKQDVEKFVARVKSSGAKILLVQPSPNFDAFDYTTKSNLQAPTCLTLHPKSIQSCENSSTKDMFDYYLSLVLSPTTIPSGTEMLPLNDLLCTSKICPMLVDSHLVYVDDDHVSFQWATFSATALGQLLRNYLPK
jgi:hypothetical protein